MADFSKMTLFLRIKSTFLKRVLPALNSTFFKCSKSNLVVKRPQILKKKIVKENFPRWRIFSRWRLSFLLATYGIWAKFWFRVEKKKIMVDFHVLGLFMAMIWAKFFFRLSRAVAVALLLLLNAKFVPRLKPRPQDLESWNFGSRSHLGQFDVLHTQN
jgi:hypothetical protein